MKLKTAKRMILALAFVCGVLSAEVYCLSAKVERRERAYMRMVAFYGRFYGHHPYRGKRSRVFGE